MGPWCWQAHRKQKRQKCGMHIVATGCHVTHIVSIGCQTPTEAYNAYKAGAPVQKIFPGVAGGAASWARHGVRGLQHGNCSCQRLGGRKPVFYASA